MAYALSNEIKIIVLGWPLQYCNTNCSAFSL